ncbi:MAG TPA: hypothetical protein DHW22_11315, partial [Planctomycetaceae bacterium]|nr:hypothetical protein [Planctomycetaceae bacterium]
NRKALTTAIASENHIEILCAGTGGNVTREDVLAAGSIVSQLSPAPEDTNSWAAAALREWQELEMTAKALNRSTSAQFAEELRFTQGGKNLLKLGFDNDLKVCAQLDTLSVVPELDFLTGSIRLS